MKSVKSGFTRTKVPCLKNLDVLLPRIDAKQLMNDTFQDTKKKLTDLFGHQVLLSLKGFQKKKKKKKKKKMWNF